MAEYLATHYLFSETFLNACSHYPQLLQVSSFAEHGSQNDWITSMELDSSETTTLASQASLSSLSQASVDTALSSIGSSGSSLQKMTSSMPEGSSRSQGNNCSAGPLIIRKACRFDCYCSCHPRNEVEGGSKPSFSKSFSCLGLSNSPCDDPKCQSRNPMEGATDSTSNFFQKALSHVMSAHSVKVRYHLNTFHMVPESSDAMRYAKQGSLDSLKTAIQSGKATVWDTAPDGWSLLHVSIK